MTNFRFFVDVNNGARTAGLTIKHTIADAEFQFAHSGAPWLSTPYPASVFCRRRHQPRRPPLAKITPGSPAPAMGPGTPAIRCTSTVVNIVVNPKIVPHWPNDGQEAEKPKPTGSNNDEEPNVGPKSKSISLGVAVSEDGVQVSVPPVSALPCVTGLASGRMGLVELMVTSQPRMSCGTSAPRPPSVVMVPVTTFVQPKRLMNV